MKPQDLFDRLAAGYEYDPMYGVLCNERDQLKVENAKLRKENDTLMRRIDELCMENEKLRELADSSYTFAFNCYHGVFDQEVFFKLREKYHNSGIEVDE